MLERAEVVAQWDRHLRRTFPNYRFELVVLSLARERWSFDWTWINARRDPASIAAVAEARPAAWRDWVRDGSAALPRRSGARSHTRPPSTHPSRCRPPDRGRRSPGDVYAYYQQQEIGRSRLLAEMVAERVLESSGRDYVRGWITPVRATTARLCRPCSTSAPDSPGHALWYSARRSARNRAVPRAASHIARTAARLRRGWIGVYVTTSFFSRPVQAEKLRRRISADPHPRPAAAAGSSWHDVRARSDEGPTDVQELEAEYDSASRFVGRPKSFSNEQRSTPRPSGQDTCPREDESKDRTSSISGRGVGCWLGR